MSLPPDFILPFGTGYGAHGETEERYLEMCPAEVNDKDKIVASMFCVYKKPTTVKPRSAELFEQELQKVLHLT